MTLSDFLWKLRRSPMPFVLGVAVWPAATLSAQTPDMTGTWQMDTAKSTVADGRTVTLVVESTASKIKLNATIHDKAGHDSTADFTCAPDGKECEFREGGHKSKMSMWFAGDSLNVAKTDGPAGDVVNEWKLQMSSGGKALTLTVTHIDPAAPDEVLVFSKAAS